MHDVTRPKTADIASKDGTADNGHKQRSLSLGVPQCLTADTGGIAETADRSAILSAKFIARQARRRSSKSLNTKLPDTSRHGHDLLTRCSSECVSELSQAA